MADVQRVKGARQALSLIAATCIGMTAVACGGETTGGPSSTCGGGSACGGDLTGTWTVAIECVNAQASTPFVDNSSTPPECRTAFAASFGAATYDSVDLKASFSGTEFRESGSYTVTLPITFTSACLGALGAPAADAATCDSIAGSFGQSGKITGSCTPMAGGCACTMTLTDSLNVSAPYKPEGNRYVTASGVAVDYCVMGNTATIYENGLGLSGRLKLTRAADGGP